MGNSASANDDGDEQNAHKILVIRTKDSAGYLLIGANKQAGYYHSKKYVSFSHSGQNVTIALSLWDTPAIDFSANVHDQVTSPYYQFAHGLFCVYNVESMDSFNLMCSKISFYANPQTTPFKDLSKVAIMLIGHKTKHFEESMRRVDEEKAIKFANALDIIFFEISSSDYMDMSDLYTLMSKQIFQIYGELPLKNKEIVTTTTDNVINNTQRIQKQNRTQEQHQSNEDEKVSAYRSESESCSNSLSELSDIGTNEYNEPIHKNKKVLSPICLHERAPKIIYFDISVHQRRKCLKVDIRTASIAIPFHCVLSILLKIVSKCHIFMSYFQSSTTMIFA